MMSQRLKFKMLIKVLKLKKYLGYLYNMCKKFMIELMFDTEEEFMEFISEYSVFKKKKVNKHQPTTTTTTDKKPDMRGSSTKRLHQAAKQIKEASPELSYKQALSNAGKVLRNKDITN